MNDLHRASVPDRCSVKAYSVLVGLAALCACCSNSSEQAPADSKYVPSPARPAHSVAAAYAFWSLPNQGSSPGIETSFRVVSDPGPGSNYYWSTQFYYFSATGDPIADEQGNLRGGYMGLQTPAASDGGRAVLFSLWHVRDGSDVAADLKASWVPGSEAYPGTKCEAFGGEGTGIHCLAPYPWVANRKYRLRMQNVGALRYRCIVSDESSSPPVETVIADLLVPAAVLWLGGSVTQFIEYFGVAPESCSQLPYASALLEPPITDAGRIVGLAQGTAIGTNYCANSGAFEDPGGGGFYLNSGTPAAHVDLRLRARTTHGFIATTRDASSGCGSGAVRTLESAEYDDCQRITEVEQGNGKVLLQTENGTRITCDANGNVSASAWGSSEGELAWQTFVRSGEDVTSYRNEATSHYLSVTASGALRCDALTAGPSESFTREIL